MKNREIPLNLTNECSVGIHRRVETELIPKRVKRSPGTCPQGLVPVVQPHNNAMPDSQARSWC
jgi:hypothetical protein